VWEHFSYCLAAHLRSLEGTWNGNEVVTYTLIMLRQVCFIMTCVRVFDHLGTANLLKMVVHIQSLYDNA
jgi:hypothetical protein